MFRMTTNVVVVDVLEVDEKPNTGGVCSSRMLIKTAVV